MAAMAAGQEAVPLHKNDGPRSSAEPAASTKVDQIEPIKGIPGAQLLWTLVAGLWFGFALQVRTVSCSS